ncbi:MAG: T9SS type A sorting domain-containing protein [Flavobacterium sp.]|uniref:T9SS type A sorting domain-containing protein n=1 Tax=Flavobacterium sp. TaxID=239 RepID=UPI0022CB1592|nr:T9SS type A sorting domain-containing protein [Flavobacterium sp.]MCZ8197404.1 T9SS type A sorting domain-containing protein [Flavobacterium sp.]
MKKIFAIVFLLLVTILEAQTATVIKNVTSSLKPTGNSNKADLNYAKWNGKVFYSGTGSNILCVTDGTSAGTMGISSLGGSTNISNIIPAQDFVYVITSDITFSPSIASIDKIWKSDGTTAGTSLVYEFQAASGFSNAGVYYSVSGHKKNYSVDGNILFFSAYDSVNGKEIWKTNGTTAGTTMIKDVKSGTGSSQASGFCKIQSSILFIAQSVGFESKLWKTDGTIEGTEQIPVAEPFYIVNQDMAKLGNKVIFFAHNTVDGYEPYVSDGTAAGTFMLKNINPNGNSLTTQAMGLHLKMNGQYCFFIANNGINTSLWRTDGTADGTIEVIPNVTNGISDAGYSATDIDNIWFINYQGTNASQQLYKSNGTVSGSLQVHSNLSYAQNLSTFNGALWFQARDIGSNANAEVWKSNGLTSNTQLEIDVDPLVVMGIKLSSDPFGFFELNNKLYFWGKGSSGNEDNLYQYESSLSIDQKSFDNEILLFPNPSKGEFTIETSIEMVGANVKIYSIIGQKVKEFKLDSFVSKNNLDKGTYFIEIEKNGNKTTQKLIVN